MPAIKLDPRAKGPRISPFLFGHNLEHTRRAMWRGLSAQLLANRKFAGEVPGRNGNGEAAGMRNKVGADGVVASWYATGDATFAHDTTVGYAGNESQRITLGGTADVGASGGIGQKDITLKEHTAYEFRVFVKASAHTTSTLRICDESAQHDYVKHSSAVNPDDWSCIHVPFVAPSTDEHCRLEITFQGPATIWVGAVSLLPSHNFLGLRTDVVDLLRDMSAPMLRWPGGNFTLDYRWQDGLLPVDRRPTIKHGMTEVLPFSDSCDFHEIGIDEFIALCRRLNAEPFLTVNLRPQDIATPDDAAAWIEYCNGSPETEFGKLRSDRGHPDPYRVKYWSIGNEVWGAHMLQSHSDAHVYAARAIDYAQAMKSADPSIVLAAVGIPAAVWDGIVVKEAGAYFDYLSIHDYAKPEGHDAASFKRLADHASIAVLKKLTDCRKIVDENSPLNKSIGLAFDEWNIWHNWFAAPFTEEWHVGPVDGAFTAALHNMICREAETLNIPISAYFQPINEGAIAVTPLAANLTPVGQVFKLFRAHHGQRLVSAKETGGVDACASLSMDGKRFCITIVSHDPGHDETIAIELHVEPAREATLQLLVAADTTPDKPMQERTTKLPRSQTLSFVLPRFGIALVTIPLA